jgi:hypothetical protein
MKLSHSRPKTVVRDSGSWTPNGCWLQRFVRLLPDNKYDWMWLIARVLVAVTLGLLAVLYWKILCDGMPAK